MSRGTKIVLGILGGMLVLGIVTVVVLVAMVGVAGRALARSIEVESAEVAAAASEIAEFELPAGYTTGYVLQMGDVSTVAYDPGDSHSHIYLIQIPKNAELDADHIEQYLQLAAEQSNRDHFDTKAVGETQATIRGQDVTLLISEGTNNDGETFRQVSGVFEGANGPVVFVVEEPLSRWDQAEVDAFIASIH